MADTEGRDRHDPWRNGHIRTVIIRKITGEENVSIEAYHATEEAAQAFLDTYLDTLRKHMTAYNKRVILTYQKKMRDLDRMIHERGETIAQLDQEIESRQAQDAPVPQPPGIFLPLDEDEPPPLNGSGE